MARHRHSLVPARNSTRGTTGRGPSDSIPQSGGIQVLSNPTLRWTTEPNNLMVNGGFEDAEDFT
jgi:hypothetical protein